jgi:hypothetical protein
MSGKIQIPSTHTSDHILATYFYKGMQDFLLVSEKLLHSMIELVQHVRRNAEYK